MSSGTLTQVRNVLDPHELIHPPPLPPEMFCRRSFEIFLSCVNPKTYKLLGKFQESAGEGSLDSQMSSPPHFFLESLQILRKFLAVIISKRSRFQNQTPPSK